MMIAEANRITLGAGSDLARREPRHWVPMILSLYIAFVFVQSLFYKFTDSEETQFIFATLDAWAAGFAVPGLFNPGGIFSAKVIGSLELVSSALLLAALATRLVALRVAGSLVAVAIISGAIFFHLFTPLGVEIMGDGGLLFGMACGVWLAAVAMLIRDRGFIIAFLSRFKA
jgi:uncharacterized membrane protein YphA (DoxX/SURF4 family)